MAKPTTSSSNTDYGTKDLVSLVSAQNAALNQLWTMFVVATFTAGAFAVTATKEHSLELLLAGGIGFLAFAIGHFTMVMSSLNTMNACAQDIRERSDQAESFQSLKKLALPHNVLSARVVHAVIDGCVVGAYIYCALTVAGKL